MRKRKGKNLIVWLAVGLLIQFPTVPLASAEESGTASQIPVNMSAVDFAAEALFDDGRVSIVGPGTFGIRLVEKVMSKLRAEGFISSDPNAVPPQVEGNRPQGISTLEDALKAVLAEISTDDTSLFPYEPTVPSFTTAAVDANDFWTSLLPPVFGPASKFSADLFAALFADGGWGDWFMSGNDARWGWWVGDGARFLDDFTSPKPYLDNRVDNFGNGWGHIGNRPDDTPWKFPNSSRPENNYDYVLPQLLQYPSYDYTMSNINPNSPTSGGGGASSTFSPTSTTPTTFTSPAPTMPTSTTTTTSGGGSTSTPTPSSSPR